LISGSTSERQPGGDNIGSKILRPGGSASLGLILIATFLVYLPSLFNDFTNWDDEIYILNNPLITHLTPGSVGNLFSTEQYMGNYHPVTLFSYAVDYAIGELHPFIYHLDNLLLHLFCVVFLYLFLLELKLPAGVPFVVCLLFGIHPLHVEPVAWLSARKEVLYGAFFLSSLFCYIKYVGNGTKTSWYAFAFILFLLSVLSKATAVVIPAVLFLVDWYMERPLQRRIILEKIPFILVSLAAGFIAIEAQQAAKSISGNPAYGLFDRLCIGGYGLWNYLLKILAPTNLSALYFYPSTESSHLPGQFILAFAGAIVLVGISVYLARRNRSYFFGAVFFFVTIVLVLQVIPVGRAIMADRYAYIPSAGIFIILAVASEKALSMLRHKSSSFVVTLQLAAWLYCLWLGISTAERCGVWKNGITVWSDVIQNNPHDPGLYNSRGQAYLAAGNPQEALVDFEKAIAMKPDYKHALTDRGLAHFALQQLDSALRDFSLAIGTDSTFSLAYYDRANTYARQTHYTLALDDYTTAIRLKPDYGEAYYNRAIVELALGDSSSACMDYQKAVKWLPNPPKTPAGTFCR